MKAKFVYENMEFERRKDPKSAMGIGNKMAQLSDRTGIDYASLRFDRDLLLEIVSRNYKEEGFIYFVDDLIVWMRSLNNGDILPSSPVYDCIIWAHRNPKDAWELINIPKDQIYLDEIKEGLEFERGGDPKDAMGIGKSAFEKFAVGNIYSVLFFQDKVYNNIKNRFFKIPLAEVYWIGNDWSLRRNSEYYHKILKLIEDGELIKEHSHIMGARKDERTTYQFFDTSAGKLLVINSSFVDFFGTLSVAAYLDVNQVPELVNDVNNYKKW